jgi:TolB-like protein
MRDGVDKMSALIHFENSQNFSSFEMNVVLEQILESRIFKPAHRMCRLLRYLIEQTQTDMPRNMSEYAIALDVFDRNPSNYYPGEDPVVRVQMGRLRKRLSSYYALMPEQPSIRISIPVGQYKPLIERCIAHSTCTRKPTETTMPALLTILPLHYISDDFLGRALTKSINERFSLEMSSLFSSTLSFYPSGSDQVETMPRMSGSRTLLEGSTCLQGHNLRFSVRLVDEISNAILYTKQGSLPANANLSQQTQVVREICEQVRRFMED